MTWNIEGIKRGVHVLSEILLTQNIQLAFLSEPQIYQTDIHHCMEYLHGHYNFFLNSEDLTDPLLPLEESHPHGGPLVLWRKDLDP